MQDFKGIENNIEILTQFTNNFKKVRDAGPTPEEALKARLKSIQYQKENKIDISPAD